MKAALSIVLAGLLVTLPIKQVLAQAVQQEVGSEQRTAPPDGHRLIGVTNDASRLWRNPSGRALLSTEFAGAPVVQDDDEFSFNDLPTGVQVVIFVAVVAIVVYVVVRYIVVCSRECGG